MPLDKMYTDPMLNPFRNMMQDVNSKGLTGPDVDIMRDTLNLMEQYALQYDDVGAYSGKLAQDQLYMKFSDAYSRALSAAAAPAEGEQFEDADLLKQTLTAYESALSTYENSDDEYQKMLIPFVKEIIDLGHSGISFPVFLRILEEKNLNDVLNGAVPLNRKAIKESLDFSKKYWARWDIEKYEKQLILFENLVEKAPFGIPDPQQFNLECNRIDWELKPHRYHWDTAIRHWETLLSHLHWWLDSFSNFAFYDERWRPVGATDEQVRKNIKRTKECMPGEFRFREAIFKEYFGLEFKDLWNHETFKWQYTCGLVDFNDERLYLLIETFFHCYPGWVPPKELVTKTEQMHEKRKLNPPAPKDPDNPFPPPETPLKSFPLPPSML